MYGNNRKRQLQAVHGFPKNLKAYWVPAHKVMTVDDPFEEVCYGDTLPNDLGNKYLDELTIERVLKNRW